MSFAVLPLRGGHMQLDHVVGLPEPRNPHVQDLTVDSLQWFEREMSLVGGHNTTEQHVVTTCWQQQLKPAIPLQ